MGTVDKKEAGKKLKRELRIAAAEKLRPMVVERPGAIGKFKIRRPYVSFEYMLAIGGSFTAECVGFAKQNPVDKWDTQRGKAKALDRAFVDGLDAVVNRRLSILHESGALKQYFDGELPLDRIVKLGDVEFKVV